MLQVCDFMDPVVSYVLSFSSLFWLNQEALPNRLDLNRLCAHMVGLGKALVAEAD